MERITRGLVFGVVMMAVGLSMFGMSMQHVKGYIRKDGTVVASYWRTMPDRITWNNIGFWKEIVK